MWLSLARILSHQAAIASSEKKNPAGENPTYFEAREEAESDTLPFKRRQTSLRCVCLIEVENSFDAQIANPQSLHPRQSGDYAIGDDLYNYIYTLLVTSTQP